MNIEHIHIITIRSCNNFTKKIVKTVDSKYASDIELTLDEYTMKQNRIQCRHSPNNPPETYEITVLAGICINGLEIPSLNETEGIYRCC